MTATADLFREDSYLRECRARVLGVRDDGGIVLDRTVFYATGGGQPGDTGTLVIADGGETPIANTVYGEGKQEIVHLPGPGAEPPPVGAEATIRLDWDRRYRLMRMHTCLHLLSVVLPYPVTGGSIGLEEGRLDFDIPDGGLEREEVAARLNELIGRDAPVRHRWISDAELEANPALVKTMSVKPPMGSGRVRLIEIEGLDLQPCGGTHVARTGEIGRAEITRIEKKGRLNRRVRVTLA